MDAVEFHIVEHLRTASSDKDRAAMLLRLPDAVLLEEGHELLRVCSHAGFLSGVRYLLVRTASLSSVRDQAGRLRADVLAEVESKRQTLMQIAEVSP